MLKKLESLRSSLSEDQRSKIETALPDDISKDFFEVEDESSAEKLIKKINEYLKVKPLIAFGLFKILKPEQRKIIADFIDDEV